MALADVLTVVLQVAFDSSPNDPPVWTTIASNTTKKLRSWQINRGRDSTLDQFRAGTASFVLDNRDRAFDPLHSAGAFFGKLLPGKRVRLQVTYAGTTYTRFDGLADGWPQEYPSPTSRDAMVTLSATDGFKRLGRVRLSSVHSQVVAASSPYAWFRLGESSGTVAFDAAGNHRHGVHEGGVTFNGRASLVVGSGDGALGFDGVDDVTRVDKAGLTGDEWTVSAIIQHGEVDANDRVIWEQKSVGGQVTTFAISGTASPDPGRLFAQQVTSPTTGDVVVGDARVDDDSPHRVALVSDGTNIKIVVDGAQDAVAGAFVALAAPESVSIGHGDAANSLLVIAGSGRFAGVIDEVELHARALSTVELEDANAAAIAPWEGDTPGARMTKVLDAVQWPAADRDIDAGSAALAAALIDDVDALSHLQAVAETEGGRLFMSRDGKATLVARHTFWSAGEYTTSQATFSDDGAGLPYSGFGWDWSDNKVRNEVRINPQTGSEQSATDAASVDAHGPIGHSQQSLETDMSKVASQATWLLSKFADPAFEVERLDVDPLRAPTTVFPVVLGAELGYRYTVERTPQGVGSQIVQQVQLEGTREAGDSDGYRFSWSLSRAEPAVWILGSGVLGATTVPGY